ncbi:hypothetical protein MP228_004810 [Amoeboaphelidium protococcarum]|nr:hypothetical protein MP228_004810 [Amoeboaphelidium protococcarum]
MMIQQKSVIDGVVPVVSSVPAMMINLPPVVPGSSSAQQSRMNGVQLPQIQQVIDSSLHHQHQHQHHHQNRKFDKLPKFVVKKQVIIAPKVQSHHHHHHQQYRQSAPPESTAPQLFNVPAPVTQSSKSSIARQKQYSSTTTAAAAAGGAVRKAKVQRSPLRNIKAKASSIPPPVIMTQESLIQRTVSVVVEEVLHAISLRLKYHDSAARHHLMSRLSCDDIVKEIKRRHPFIGSWYMLQSGSTDQDGWSRLVPFALLGKAGLNLGFSSYAMGQSCGIGSNNSSNSHLPSTSSPEMKHDSIDALDIALSQEQEMCKLTFLSNVITYHKAQNDAIVVCTSKPFVLADSFRYQNVKCISSATEVVNMTFHVGSDGRAFVNLAQNC